jgi:hypothetical protein
MVVDHDPQAEERLLLWLAAWLLRFVPDVGKGDAWSGAVAGGATPASGSACLVGNLTGCERIIAQRYGSEEALLHTLSRLLDRRGWASRWAIASTVGAAWAVAHAGTSDAAPSGAASGTGSSGIDSSGTGSCGIAVGRAKRRVAVSATAPVVMVVPPGVEATVTALAPLPLEALRCAVDDVAALHEVHVSTIGALMRLDRNELAERLRRRSGGMGRRRRSERPDDEDEARLVLAKDGGDRAARPDPNDRAARPDPVHRLEQALGHAPETIVPLRPPITCRVARDFTGPVLDPEAVQLASADLVDRLCRVLRDRGRGARRLRWTAFRVDASPIVVELHPSRVVRRRGQIWSLLRPSLEQVDAGFGIDRIELAATRTTAVGHGEWVHPALRGQRRGRRCDRDQTMHDGFHPDGDECLDRIAARLQSASAEPPLRAEATAAHEPELAFRFVPWHRRHARGQGAAAVVDGRAALLGVAGFCGSGADDDAADPLRGDVAVAPSLHAERPTLLLSQPRPVDVLLVRAADVAALEFEEQRWSHARSSSERMLALRFSLATTSAVRTGSRSDARPDPRPDPRPNACPDAGARTVAASAWHPVCAECAAVDAEEWIEERWWSSLDRVPSHAASPGPLSEMTSGTTSATASIGAPMRRYRRVQLATGLWLWLWRHAPLPTPLPMSLTMSLPMSLTKPISDAPRGPPSDGYAGGAIDAMELLRWFGTGPPKHAAWVSRPERPERIEQCNCMGRIERWWLHGMWC